MKNAYDIILKPVITEQSMEATEEKKYVFKVAVDANKSEIKEGSGGDLRREGRKGQHPAHGWQDEAPGRRSRRPPRQLQEGHGQLTADSKTIEFFEGMV